MGLAASSQQEATASLPALPRSDAASQTQPASHMLQCELCLTCLTPVLVPAVSGVDTEQDSASCEAPEELHRVGKEEMEEEVSYTGQAELMAQQQEQQDLECCQEEFLDGDTVGQAVLLLQPQQRHGEAAQSLHPPAAASTGAEKVLAQSVQSCAELLLDSKDFIVQIEGQAVLVVKHQEEEQEVAQSPEASEDLLMDTPLQKGRGRAELAPQITLTPGDAN